MGLTKTKNFTREQNELAAIAKVLAHPARIAILEHLLKVDQCIGGEIVEEIPLAQPTISRHLKELKSIGIIKGDTEGNRVNYCIDAARWKEVQAMMNGLFDTMVKEQDCC
ncbi:MAG: metalloregulator ArsR/SmtB family transcription factor [Saprospiraceae bacterium]|nr:metalloregulator ArsR/SmtB family transcription factor [Saprospiraceae bacterium]MCF8250544.1 metalloregulator ArsR/SmtB family transcription factor [Saprospiraceae bacterium]MCF8279684.1 metalloregulator ArsR/SmtB family transcription factor [Bacteroidales bacterium]MCF8312470.1 metalloregulator ArsR/SmtB family transcription factor [Saprospiraceae bacterium]MCF8440713.1 metalloregulator ArsR/SmtB family transcription factor [Saprospiraceae bacterium]